MTTLKIILRNVAVRQGLILVVLALGVMVFITSARSKTKSLAPKSCAQMFPADAAYDAAFEDAIDGGTCWACPKGTRRGTAAVNSANACLKYTKAQNVGKYGCQAKYGATAFSDLGACWTCPSGYKRTAEAVTSDKACAKDFVFGPFSKASKMGTANCNTGQPDPVNGGTCWTCGQGKRTVYPVNGDQACEVGVRATKRGDASINTIAISKAAEQKIKQVTQNFANRNGEVMKKMYEIFQKMNSSKYSAYFAPNGPFTKAVEAKQYDKIWIFLKADLSPIFAEIKKIQLEQGQNLQRFTVVSFGLTGEASFVGGVSVEEGISLDFWDPANVKVEGYVSYGAVVGITAGVASGVAVNLSKRPAAGEDSCGAGFGIGVGFGIPGGSVGVGGGIAIDPNLPCSGNLEDLLTLNAIQGISIGVSVGAGPLPADIKANFTSNVTYKLANGRLVSTCLSCGGSGQRPCGVTERIPSCNPGLSEKCGKCS